VHYTGLHPDCETANDSTWIIDKSSTVQPDCFLRYVQGNSWLDEQSYLRGAPELVVEISASTVSMDSHQKKANYERAGVREYIVWRVIDKVIDIWRYDDQTKSFLAAPPNADRIWSSAVFPGLVLDLAAVMEMNSQAAIRHMT
jgi:Uma2 family endonuclease